jgi:hypothetical protein
MKKIMICILLLMSSTHLSAGEGGSDGGPRITARILKIEDYQTIDLDSPRRITISLSREGGQAGGGGPVSRYVFNRSSVMDVEYKSGEVVDARDLLANYFVKKIKDTIVIEAGVDSPVESIGLSDGTILELSIQPNN